MFFLGELLPRGSYHFIHMRKDYISFIKRVRQDTDVLSDLLFSTNENRPPLTILSHHLLFAMISVRPAQLSMHSDMMAWSRLSMA